MEELNPRQIEFLRLYNDPKSETFGNAKQSAIKAGYSKEYANNLTVLYPDWLSENIGRRKRLLNKAEKNLEDILDMEAGVIANKDGEMIEASNIEVMKLKNNASQFVAKTVGKEYYSERTEHTGKDGKDLIPDDISIEKAKQAIHEFFNPGDSKQQQPEVNQSTVPVQE